MREECDQREASALKEKADCDKSDDEQVGTCEECESTDQCQNMGYGAIDVMLCRACYAAAQLLRAEDACSDSNSDASGDEHVSDGQLSPAEPDPTFDMLHQISDHDSDDSVQRVESLTCLAFVFTFFNS